MWSVIQWLVLRFAALRWLSKLFGLALFVPFAFLLKLIGLPLLAVLAVIGLPILALLFLFGLPIIFVMIFGGLMMGLVGVVLSIGFAALKIAIFVVLPIWLFWTVASWTWSKCKRSGDSDSSGGSAPPSSGSPNQPPPATGPIHSAEDMPPGADPA